MGSSMMLFESISLIVTRNIPDYMWGPKLKGLYRFAKFLGFLNGLFNIVFGFLCVYSFKHYRFAYEQLKDDPEINRMYLRDRGPAPDESLSKKNIM